MILATPSLRMHSEAVKLIMVFWCLFVFIASGFEHSIANQSFLSMEMCLPHGAEILLNGFSHLIYKRIRQFKWASKEAATLPKQTDENKF